MQLKHASPARRAWPLLPAVLILATACATPPATAQPAATSTSAPAPAAPPTLMPAATEAPPTIATVVLEPTTAPRVPPVSAAAVFAQVAPDAGASLRAEPRTGAAAIKTLPAGTLVLVVGPDRDVEGRLWRQVRDEAGGEGWVAADLLVAPGVAPVGVAESAPGSVPEPAGGSDGSAEQPQAGAMATTAAPAPAEAGTQMVRFLVPTIT